jgi:competence protein ComEA
MQVPNLPEIDPKLLKLTALISGCALLVGAVLWVQGRPQPIDVLPTFTETQTEPTGIFVHVVGEVTKPGVYELRQGDRVVDAIESAGGITKSADLTSLNLARVLFDGEQIVVSDRSAVASLSSGIGLISINRATAADLDSLPGIGPVIASRIVSYRETNGPFTSISSLTEVSGIGEALMSKIKDLVTL